MTDIPPYPSHAQINALSPLQHKVWIKPNAEQSFLYGNHIMKAGLGRMTESTPKYGCGWACDVPSSNTSTTISAIALLQPCTGGSSSPPFSLPLTQTPRRDHLQYERYPAGVRGVGVLDRRLPVTRPHQEGRLPPSRPGRIPPRRGPYELAGAPRQL